MDWRNSATRYGLVAQALHWVIVLMLVAQYTLASRAKDLPLGLARLQLVDWHKSLGLAILLVMLLRLAWRLANAPPPLPPMPRWQALASRASHSALYALLLVQPVVGWLYSSAANYPVTLLGWLQLPMLVAPDEALKEALQDLHGILAAALVGLIALHVLAALKHQFYDEDGLLGRMLPWR